jgi:ketopantoate reductase
MKLGVNSCINPLTALIRRRNGAVVDDARWVGGGCVGGGWRKLMEEANHESCGMPINSPRPPDRPPINTHIHTSTTNSLQPLVAALCAEAAAVAAAVSAPASFSIDAAELEAYVRRVAAQTGRNESSMLRDVAAGRLTEAS